MYSCVQNLVISSAKVGWKKQGTCVLVDNEPAPPKLEGYEADKGWKEVKSFMVSSGGGNFLFPEDQLLLVTDKGYKAIAATNARQLSKLSSSKHYLIWYHHVMPTKVWQERARKK